MSFGYSSGIVKLDTVKNGSVLASRPFTGDVSKSMNPLQILIFLSTSLTI